MTHLMVGRADDVGWGAGVTLPVVRMKCSLTGLDTGYDRVGRQQPRLFGKSRRGWESLFGVSFHAAESMGILA